MSKVHTLTAAVVGAAFVAAASGAAVAADPVKLRWASDHTGPPHPAAIAEIRFAEEVEKRIPGSKVQIYWAKSLYTVPQGVKALTQGNLEIMTGQFGKASSVEPLSNVVLGAGKLTTVGAIDAIDKTKTFKALADHYNKVHNITLKGAGHLSMYMGAGAVKERLIEPADFAGKNQTVRRHQRLDARADVRSGRHEHIDDFVGNPIADLVGMSFGNGFTRKQIVPSPQTSLH